MIEVKNLVKKYGDLTAVDNVSFSVEKGKIYGFLGPNGAGKTTTLNIITGYLGATSGDVLINGHDIAKEAETAKKYIGFLPEQPPLYLDMTVYEFLDFVAGIKKVQKSEREGKNNKIMEKTRIAHEKNRLIKNLSKGYRQRVGLAQALVGDPEIIILDEPTAGLDPKQIIEARSLIRELSEERTVLFSTHILSEAQEICDHIFIINHGKLVANGPAEELERQMSDSAELQLSIKGVEDDVKNAFSKIEGIGQMSIRPSRESGFLEVTIERKRNQDIREEIFYACAAANLPILMMKSSYATLEDVFLRLTSDSQQPVHAPEESEEIAPEKEENHD